MENLLVYLPYLLFFLNFCLNVVLLLRRSKPSTDWLSVVKYLVNSFSSGSNQVIDDPSGSNQVINDPSGSNQVINDPSRSNQVINDPSRSNQVINDPSGSNQNRIVSALQELDALIARLKYNGD